jgi:Putative metal-binding motif
MKLSLLFIIFLGLLQGCYGESGVIGEKVINNNNQTNNANNINNINNTNAGTCPDGTDYDNDGYGDDCPAGIDCNDLNPDINPGATEVCNTIDDNCDGVIDEGCTCLSGQIRICHSEVDPRGITSEMRCRTGYELCENSEWSGDCIGETTGIPETCNGIDDNCDGDIDEGVLNDMGECGSSVPPPEDCGPTGEGNGLDDNGNGLVDETCDCTVPGYDPDLPRTDQPCYSGLPHTLGVGICHGGVRDCLAGGTWGTCTAEQTPAVELCGDLLDNDCDGFVDEGCPSCPGSSPEVCDGIDNDCNGIIDEGVTLACGGCGPYPDEVCSDGLDNNCDGSIDEGCNECLSQQQCYPGPPETVDVGACAWGSRSCTGEFWGPCTGYTLPFIELCGEDGTGNGIDEDCDGLVDEGCICPEGASRYCGDGAGFCEYGIQTCNNNVWGPCLGGTDPVTEICNSIDDDCDGLTDEDLLNACGTCDESCYDLPMDPTTVGTPDEGIATIPSTDPDNPTGEDGITLTKASFIPPYLWAANQTNFSLTKFNTDTHTQEGIYWVANNPSRSAVDLDGNVWVAGRDDGRVTKILWDSSSCPDTNGVPGIQTSTGTNQVNSAADPLYDDCVVYSAVPEPSRPSVRGLAAGPNGKIWIGYTNGGLQSIDTTTFALSPFYQGIGQVPTYQPDANGVQQLTGGMENPNNVYGLVVDSQGFLYIAAVADRTSFTVFDTVTETWVGRFHGLCGSYGIALDGEGRIWFGSYTGCSGVGMYDPSSRIIYAFTIPTTVNPALMMPGDTSGVTLLSGDCKAQQIGSSILQVTGLSTEPKTGNIWASHWQTGYTMRLEVDNLNLANSQITFIGTLRKSTGALLDEVSSTDLRGVGFDQHGFAWTLGLNSDRVFKLDPATNAREATLPLGKAIGIGSHYTYSDFTGSTALSFTAPRGFWTYIFNSLFDMAQVDSIVWDAYVPTGTTAGVRVRALDENGNPISAWLPPDISGVAQYFDYPALSPTHTVDLHSNGGPLLGWSFELQIRLTTTDRDIRPIVNDVHLEWQRP